MSSTIRLANSTKPRVPPGELVPTRNPVWRAGLDRPNEIGELTRKPLTSMTNRGLEAQEIHEYPPRKYGEYGLMAKLHDDQRVRPCLYLPLGAG